MFLFTLHHSSPRSNTSVQSPLTSSIIHPINNTSILSQHVLSPLLALFSILLYLPLLTPIITLSTTTLSSGLKPAHLQMIYDTLSAANLANPALLARAHATHFTLTPYLGTPLHPNDTSMKYDTIEVLLPLPLYCPPTHTLSIAFLISVSVLRSQQLGKTLARKTHTGSHRGHCLLATEIQHPRHLPPKVCLLPDSTCSICNLNQLNN